MRKMKYVCMLLLLLALLLALCACGAAAPAAETPAAPAAEAAAEPQPQAPETAQPQAPAPEPAGKDTLVVYFSATGTTKGVAEKIAAITDADLYEIVPAQPYTEEDRNWHDDASRTTLEQNDKTARPELAGEPVSLEGYTTVYLGYPIWWGEEPRIVDTFVEQCDFDGVTVIPFCTSGSSGIGSSGQNLAALAGSGSWLDGQRFGGGAAEADIQAWIESLR